MACLPKDGLVGPLLWQVSWDQYAKEHCRSNCFTFSHCARQWYHTCSHSLEMSPAMCRTLLIIRIARALYSNTARLGVMCTTCCVFILPSMCSTLQQMLPLVWGHLMIVWAETEVAQERLCSQCSYITTNTILIL